MPQVQSKLALLHSEFSIWSLLRAGTTVLLVSLQYKRQDTGSRGCYRPEDDFFPVTTFPSSQLNNRNTTDSWSPTLHQALAQDPERLSNTPCPNPLSSCCTRKVYTPTPMSHSFLCICPCDTPVKQLSATSPFLNRDKETNKKKKDLSTWKNH